MYPFPVGKKRDKAWMNRCVFLFLEILDRRCHHCIKIQKPLSSFIMLFSLIFQKYFTATTRSIPVFRRGSENFPLSLPNCKSLQKITLVQQQSGLSNDMDYHTRQNCIAILQVSARSLDSTVTNELLIRHANKFANG